MRRGSVRRPAVGAVPLRYRRSMVITQAGEAPTAPPWFARLSGRLSRVRWHRDDAKAPDTVDGLIAVGCFAGFTLPVLTGLASRIGSPLAVTGFGVLAAAPLVVRRRWPAAALAADAAVYVAATLAGVRFTPWVSNAGPNLAIATFTAADRERRRVSLTVSALAAVATWAVLPLAMDVLHPGQGQDAVQLALMVPAWLAGDTVRARRTYRQRLAAERRHRAAEEAGRARAEERLRLSREVHDVVSHSLSMIAVRSGVARLLLDEQPEQARAALATIETASRSALDELRSLLRQIRDVGTDGETATPVLADLPALVDRLRGSGLDVTYRCTGEPAGYGAALELSAYRIAQEALTNVAKHAPGARAWLEVTHGPGALSITVTDDGPGVPQPAPPSAGLGITGMRERAAMLGGQLTAATRPEGGFAVVARLPVQEAR
jgi:signal transduction histidine kinase